MYTIYADDVCIYNDQSPLNSLKVIDPKLTMEDNSAGSLSMKLPPTNIGYNTIARMTTDISVKKDGQEIWAGRVLSEEKDFWNNRSLTCEGELAFFNDSTQPPMEYHNKTVRGFLEALISVHNSKVPENRQFTVGAVTVKDPNDSLYRYTNYEKTIECINDKLIDRLDGHLSIRKVNGVRYLDYLADYSNTNSQTIEFGKNLLDFTREWDSTEFATVIVPLGNRLDESPIETLDAYLTVASVNDGSIYVQSDESVAAYGWIEKVVNWDDVSTASALLSKAKAYLSDLQFDNVTIELSAVDLHYLNADYEAVKLLDKIRVVSNPHGMDRYFPVKKLEIPLDKPENTQFTLGDNIKTTLTSVNNATNAETLKKIDLLPKASAILTEAKNNATALLNYATNGYITITQDDYGTNTLYVSDNRDYTKASKLWKWNMNGLGYSKDGGNTYGLAMTMDGSIVADYINTGSLTANDKNGKTVFSVNMDTGEVLIDASAITIKSESMETYIDDIKQTTDDTAKQVETSVASVAVEYYVSTSAASATGGAWSTDQPTWKDGCYIWSRTKTTTQDGNVSYSEAACITGNTGARGEKGDTGAQGIQGLQGEKGDQGIPGADGKSTYFHIKYSDDGGKTFTANSGETVGAYIGTYVDDTQTDSTSVSKYTWAQLKGAQGAQGEKGDKGIAGTNGTDGKTSYLHIAYANSADGKTGFDVGDGTNKLYIGQYTDFTQSDSTDYTKYTWTKIKGDAGATGATGKGVKSIVPQYYLSTSNTAQSGGSWSSTQPTWVANRYYWTRSYITWTDNTTTTTTPVLANDITNAAQANDAATSATTLATTVSSKVDSLQTDTEALTKAIKEYVKSSDFETYKKQVTSQLSQTPEAITARFNSIESTVKTLDNETKTALNELATYIKADTSGLTLGKSGDPITLNLNNGQITFYQGTKALAYFSDNQLYVSHLAVTDTVDLCGLRITTSGNYITVS